MIKIKLDDVKSKIFDYLEYDYSTTRMLIGLYNKGFFSTYMYGNAIILKNMRNIPFKQVGDYKIFNFQDENIDKFIEQLNSNDFLFFYSDFKITSDLLINLDKEIFLCKKITENFTDSDVYRLSIENNLEVTEFLQTSIIEEEFIDNESDTLSTVNTIKFLWQEEVKEINANSYHYCIKYNNKIIGISEVIIDPLLPNKALLANIYISIPFRRKGFGKRLLLSSMIEKDYIYYYNCHESNVNSLCTAVSSGFQKSGIMSVYIKK